MAGNKGGRVGIILYFCVGLASTSPAYILLHQDSSCVILSYLGLSFCIKAPTFRYSSCLRAQLNSLSLISYHSSFSLIPFSFILFSLILILGPFEVSISCAYLSSILYWRSLTASQAYAAAPILHQYIQKSLPSCVSA